MTAREQAETNSFSKLKFVGKFYGTPDFKRVQEKRQHALLLGAEFGTIFGQISILLDRGQTFKELVKYKKGLFTVRVLKGTLTGAITSGLYWYTATELSRARGNVDDGWNHFCAGMAAYMPYALAYGKPLQVTVYGALFAATVASLFKLGTMSDLMLSAYTTKRTTEQQTAFPELYVAKQSYISAKALE